jgi:hypothetical protein
MARSRRTQNGCQRLVGWVPPARRRHAESALSGHGPYGTSVQIVRTESRRLIITGQRRTARRVCSGTASTLWIGQHPARRELVFGCRQRTSSALPPCRLRMPPLFKP